MALKEYRIRFDGNRERDAIAIAFFQKRSDGFILVHHVTETENPHYHVYVRSTVSQGNMSNYLKKEFGVVKSDYSCKSCSPDRRLEFWAYLFNKKKGNVPTYISSQGISPLEIKLAQDNANQVAIEFETRMQKGDKKKLSKFDIAEKLSGEKMTRSELYDAVVKLLHTNRMCSNSFVIKDIMSTVLNMNNDHRLKDHILKYFTLTEI